MTEVPDVTGVPDVLGMSELSAREAAVLAVLQDAGGRVVSRGDLARAAGLAGLSSRRVDSVLVGLRRALPEGALVTVRGRGWALVHTPDVHRVGTAQKRGSHPRGTPAP